MGTIICSSYATLSTPWKLEHDGGCNHDHNLKICRSQTTNAQPIVDIHPPLLLGNFRENERDSLDAAVLVAVWYNIFLPSYAKSCQAQICPSILDTPHPMQILNWQNVRPVIGEIDYRGNQMGLWNSSLQGMAATMAMEAGKLGNSGLFCSVMVVRLNVFHLIMDRFC